eukprot:2395748-Pyramimonas_sp.AAC.1
MEEKGWWWDFSLDTHSLQHCRKRGGLQALQAVSENINKGPGKAPWVFLGHAGSNIPLLFLPVKDTCGLLVLEHLPLQGLHLRPKDSAGK